MRLAHYRLTDLLSHIVDNRGRSCPTAETGFPLIATNCVKDDQLYPVFENVRYVDQETYTNWFRDHPEPGDILFVCKGSPGRAALVPNPVPFCIAQDMVALRTDPAVINNRYLYYQLTSVDTRRKIENMHVGTMIPHFKKGDFNQLRLAIHEDLNEQAAIAEVLGALDDQIAANSRLAHTADELQRTKFHSLLADAVHVPLSDTAQFVNGKAFTKNATGFGRMVVRIAELNSGPGAATVYNDLDVDDKHLARAGDVLFAWSGSLTLHRWYRDEAIVNQHIFKVIPSPEFPSWLVFELIRHKLEEFRAVAADKATTMGHIQRRHLDEPVLVPHRAAIDSHDALMAGLWDRALKANEENLALASLRDMLLPQLMSGKLRVKNAEKVVEGAV